MDIDDLISNVQKNAGDDMGGVQGDIISRNVLYISLLIIYTALAFVLVYFTVKKRYNFPIGIACIVKTKLQLEKVGRSFCIRIFNIYFCC